MALASSLVKRIKSLFKRGGLASDPATSINLRDAVANQTGADAAELARRFTKGDITLTTFQSEMYLLSRNTIISQFALARGGMEALTPSDLVTIGEMVGKQAGYLREFVTAIGDETNAMTDEAIINRSTLYGDAGVEAHSRGEVARLGVKAPDQVPPAHPRCRCTLRYATEEGKQVVYWVTAADERVCPICSGLGTEYNPLELEAA